MTQQKVIRALVSFGLTQSDAKVYVFLAQRGPQKARDIAKPLKMPKQTLYLAIKSLLGKGMLVSSIEHPARFSAKPFEKVLRLFAEAKMEEARHIQQSKDEILADWNSISEEPDETEARFSVLEGRNAIHSKIQQIAKETKEQMCFVTTAANLLRLDQFGLFDNMVHHPLKSKIQFKYITNFSNQNVNAVETLVKRKKAGNVTIKWKTPDLGLTLVPRLLTRDGEEALFFVDPETSASYEKGDVCLWTNCSSLVKSFETVFEELWHNSIDLQEKILEIKTGKLTPNTGYITDPESAKKKYDQALQLAKKEIILKTSSDGLNDFWENMPSLKELTQKGVSLKIMAPLVSDDWQAAQDLGKYGIIKHVQPGYLETTVIDEKHLFQFKNPPEDEEISRPNPRFENVFYTNDPEYVKKTNSMLYAVWRNAHLPPNLTLKTTSRPKSKGVNPLSGRPWLEDVDATFEEIRGGLTEEYVLNKIISAKKTPPKDPKKDVIMTYGSLAIAIIHPPDHFNLPEMRIFAFHIDKQSSLGAEDMLTVYLWLETPSGSAYVPVVAISDNPQAVELRRTYPSGTSVVNQLLAKEDQIYVRVHGNTLLAGWTVPIPLSPPSLRLPPACILFEGYGEIKTGMFREKTVGRRYTCEFNGFEAFVTFFHPVSKYAGPGTDGLLYRDYVLTAQLTEEKHISQ